MVGSCLLDKIDLVVASSEVASSEVSFDVPFVLKNLEYNLSALYGAYVVLGASVVFVANSYC